MTDQQTITQDEWQAPTIASEGGQLATIGDLEAERDHWRAKAQALAIAQPQSETAAVLSMIERAARDPQVNLDKLERLFAMREKMMADNARRAFESAMAEAKAEIPPIIKNRFVSFETSKGKTEYRHEDLAEIARTIDPILGEHGLSYRFRTSSEIGQPIKVTCVISHRGGHFEENTLVGPRDESGSKNAIQSIGSTQSYLSRYTLKAALGLAASNDDDGKASGDNSGSLSDEQFSELRQLMIEAKTNEVKFCAHFKIDGVADLPVARFEEAKMMIRAAEAARKAKVAKESSP